MRSLGRSWSGGGGDGEDKYGTSWLKPGKGQISREHSIAKEPKVKFLVATIVTNHSLHSC